MERRAFIGSGAAALTAAAATACGGGSSAHTARATAAPAPTASRRAADPPSPRPASRPATAADWSALGHGLDGQLVRPGDTGWDTARLLYNTRFDGLRPAGVVYAAHPDDVRTALAYARAHGIRTAIRNGGHSYAGWSSGNGRLVVDVSALNRVRAAGGTAVVGAGAKLIDVYRALAAKGATVPAGSCPTVGISGLALGGGHGVVSRAYGLTCDHLTAATLITADGRQLTASADEHPDLFWALRGGGTGTFGVVTELRFRTRPAPQGVTGEMSWPWSRAADVVRAWQEWGPDQPDEIWSALHLANTGTGPTVSVSVFSLGTYGELQNAVDRLADAIGASARSVTLRRRSYEEAMEVYAGCSSFPSDAQCRLPGATPGRSPQGALHRETYAAKSDFFDRPVPADGVRALIDRVSRVSGGSVSVALTALGGAVNRVAPTATAFVHRGSRSLAQYIAAWDTPAASAPARAWLTAAHAAMRPYASGAAYQNYADPDLTDWRTAYYGDAAPRLAKLKRQYDPDRVFSFPQAF
ncbi:FAD-binding protein [Streptomyces sp. NPDC008150]|uniref:FAD-binding oxidoreductase n=1 Tax=Streptomyces sp. NPDC008150 TaxID=3364816 RepID=UPI0036EEBB19